MRKRIPVRDERLLATALRHRSAAGQTPAISNERLEFFGDAVLGMVIAEHFFRTHPDWDQGHLTKAKALVVQESSLAEAGLLLGLDSLVVVGPGEELAGGRKRASIVADVYEAVVGAVYLDRGLATARKFILGTCAHVLDRLDRGEAVLVDSKSSLQELAQARWKTTPRYRVVAETGTPHQPAFDVEVTVNGEVYGEGSGGSKKEAEQAAAFEALKVLLPEEP